MLYVSITAKNKEPKLKLQVVDFSHCVQVKDALYDDSMWMVRMEFLESLDDVPDMSYVSVLESRDQDLFSNLVFLLVFLG